MSVAKRLRFTDKPVISTRTSEAIEIELQDDDYKILYALAFHYHYQTAEYIAALLGRSYDTVVRRLKLLRRNGGYIRLAPEQEKNQRQHHWGFLFYAISSKGITALTERGFVVPDRTSPANLTHQVFDDQITASFEIGVNANPNLSITWFEDLDKLPDETRKLGFKGLYIPLSERGRTARADGIPYVLNRTFDGATDRLFFIGKEADCGTEPIRASDQERSSISHHFSDYIDILENEIHTKHFGARSCFIPFITTTRARKQSMMELLARRTEHRPSLRKSFLFKTHPLFTSNEKPRPTGHMITEPWDRVGYQPLYLNQP